MGDMGSAWSYTMLGCSACLGKLEQPGDEWQAPRLDIGIILILIIDRQMGNNVTTIHSCASSTCN